MPLKNFQLDSDILFDLTKIKAQTLSDSLHKRYLLSGSSGKKKNKDFVEYYDSYELIPIKKIIHLRKMLLYIINSKKLNLTIHQKEKAISNLITVSAILNNVQQGSSTFIDSNNSFCLKYDTVYGYIKNHPLGRLYPLKASITQISKEFRSFLFKEIYLDVDIQNAHPTILYVYSKSRGLYTPFLEQLSLNRNMFYEQVYNESKSISKEALKKLTLACLNMSNSKFESISLNKLNKEVTLIRKSLFEEYYIQDQSFKDAIDFRMHEEKTQDPTKRLQKVQSLYCYNIETEHIMQFRKLVIKKWFDVEISIVPFFAGLSIENIDRFITQEKYCSLSSIVQEYNEKSPIKFHLKEITTNIELFPKILFHRLSKAILYIDNLTYKKTSELIDKYGIDTNITFILKDTLSNKKPNEEITFSLKDIQEMKLHVNKKFAKFIDCILSDNTLEL